MSNTSKRSDTSGEPNEERTKELVRDHFTAINDRNRAAVLDLHADDVVVHSAERDVSGVESVLTDWWSQLDAIPDLEDTIEMLIADGERAAVRYTTTGTHEGEFRGIEPTGRTVELTSMAVVRVEGDEIVEWWNHPDRFGLYRQLGLIDPPTG